MTDYNAAAWLVDRHIAGGDGGRVAYRVGGQSTTYEALQREVWRAQHALRALDVRRGERVAMVVNDEPAFPAWFLGGLRAGVVPVPLSTMLIADRPRPPSWPTPVPASSWSPPGYAGLRRRASPGRSAELRARRRDRRPPTGRDAARCPCTRGRRSPTAARRRSPSTKRRLPRLLALQLGHDRPAEGRHAPPRQPAGDGRDVRAVGPRHRPRRTAACRWPSCSSPTASGNSLTFPLSVGGRHHPQPAAPHAGRHRRAAWRDEQPTLFFASPGFVAALLDAEIRRRRVRVGALHDHRRRGPARPTCSAGSAERFGHPVLDGIGSTEALHIFLSNTVDDQRPGTSGTPGARATTSSCSTRPTPMVDRARHAGLPPGARAVDRHRVLVPRPTPPRRRSAATGCAPATCTRAPTDGHYTFLGRNTDMIKAGGIWVSPAEVESVLIEHPDVLEAAVVGARDVSAWR